MQKSSNPVFGASAVKNAKKEMSASGVMSISGTMLKTFFLFAVLVVAALFSWRLVATASDWAWPLVIGASIVAFISILVIIFKAPGAFMSTVYAAAEGIILGAISYIYADSYDGIITQAVLLTLGMTLAMYLSYSTGFIKVTKKLKSIIIIATFGVLIYYLMIFILSLFGVDMISLFSGTSGVVIGAVIVIIAALNYLLDFDFIEKSVASKAPKQFEWYGAFGLIVTLIWLYISILNMLAAGRR